MINIWIANQLGKNFGTRTAVMLAGVLMMGYALAFLILADLGTDPFSSLNMGFSRMVDIPFGTVLLTANILLFVVVIIANYRLIGLGTIGNMVLIGYTSDFFCWIWRDLLPDPAGYSLLTRLLILIPSFAVFAVAAAVYMTCDLGMSPYDAVPFIVTDKLSKKRGKKVSFRIVRMVWDAVITLLALCFGGTVGVMTVLVILTMGPVVAKIQPIMQKLLLHYQLQEETDH